MPTWVTHLMLADRVLEALPGLHRRGFCVGSIAPDCNLENEDWTQFVPPREKTHWISGKRKAASDGERFYEECVAARRREAGSGEELSFLLGYYAHLLADAEFQRVARDAARVASAWERIRKHPVLSRRAEGMPEDWDSVKRLISSEDRRKDIAALEAEYLDGHPDSGYWTEILTLRHFPDYIDCLPRGAIVRKIGVMGGPPQRESGAFPFVALSREEFSAYLDSAAGLILRGIAR